MKNIYKTYKKNYQNNWKDTKIPKYLPRFLLIIKHKSFIRPQSDYGDNISNQSYKKAFGKKLERIHHSVYLTISGAVGGTSRKTSSKISLAIFKDIWKWIELYFTRNSDKIPLMNIKHQFFKTSLSSSTVTLHKKWIFPLRISSVRNPSWKNSFSV